MATDYSGRVGPDREWHTRPVPESILVIACGALAQEITALKRASGWDHLHLATMDAWLHNRPCNIPELLREKLRRYRDRYDRIFVAYADCGTGGLLNPALAAFPPTVARLIEQFDKVDAGEASWDGMLTEAALQSFAEDQKALDDRIRRFL